MRNGKPAVKQINANRLYSLDFTGGTCSVGHDCQWTSMCPIRKNFK